MLLVNESLDLPSRDGVQFHHAPVPRPGSMLGVGLGLVNRPIQKSEVSADRAVGFTKVIDVTTTLTRV